MTEPPAAGAPAAPLQRTPLFDFHRAHGGHLVPFAGWEMPLYYTSILAEHAAVRQAVGLFDVSHMGIFTGGGTGAAALLGRRTTANVERLAPGRAKYCFFLEASGGIVDDLLITRLDDGGAKDPSFLVVPNASRADEIDQILRQPRPPGMTLFRWNGKAAILAVQGPLSRSLLEKTFGWQLGGVGFYHARFFPLDASGAAPPEGRVGGRFPDDLGPLAHVSRTGYTGELGYELFVPGEQAAALADRLLAGGAVPCGLGARDTLRLEKGFLLSGQEFHRDRSPIAAGQERFVEFDHAFVGREALERERTDPAGVRLAGLLVDQAGAVPRHGTPVRAGGTVVAEATSGGMSPGLRRGIALAYLPRPLTAVGTPVTLDLRGQEVPAHVAALPFVKSAPAPR